MILVFATPEEARELLGLSTRQPEILRPQTSGPCVHIDPADDDDPDVIRALGLACRHPDGTCPHLDNPEILCPVKDACAAMQEIARMRDECEAEQEERDADIAAQDAVYETETPEFIEPTPEEEPVYEASPLVDEVHLDARGWTPEEERALRGATTPAEAVALYRAAYPGSSRTDAAIKSRYHQKIRPQRGSAPTPDFAGDTVPVTQYDEAALRRPRYKAGDKVRITDPALPDYTGTIRRYYAATENYLLTIDGTHDTIRLPETRLEAL